MTDEALCVYEKHSIKQIRHGEKQVSNTDKKLPKREAEVISQQRITMFQHC